jgi:hypothetical protein
MSRLIARAAHPETLRRVIVCGCAMVLIFAQQALPL